MVVFARVSGTVLHVTASSRRLEVRLDGIWAPRSAALRLSGDDGDGKTQIVLISVSAISEFLALLSCECSEPPLDIPHRVVVARDCQRRRGSRRAEVDWVDDPAARDFRWRKVPFPAEGVSHDSPAVSPGGDWTL